MASAIEYFGLLTRTQHPAYRKDFSGVPSAEASWHLIRNYLLAKQIVKLKEKLSSLEENSFPNTVNVSGIDAWETDYFNFTKPSLSIDQRQEELLKWINNKIGMSKSDVIKAAESITGKTPDIILNLNKGGWKLGSSVLGVQTILGGTDTTDSRYSYLVKFSDIVGNVLLKTLDSELTRIEKAGSKHYLSAPQVKWIIGKSSLGVDTILRN
jgi:hypothetical protein